MYGYENAGFALSTIKQYARTLRRILRLLWQYHGAPKLDDLVKDRGTVRPRNVVASREELEEILAAAKPSLRLWLLLCSDMAIRSGTARKLNGTNYDPERREMRFITKGDTRQTLPVTEEVAEILDTLDQSSPVPFVWQIRAQEGQQHHVPSTYGGDVLYKELRDIEKRLKINRRIIPHDLRRTTAVAMFNATGDLRAVKALLGHSDLKTTLWYLDHDATPVKRSTLELIKRPSWTRKEVA